MKRKSFTRTVVIVLPLLFLLGSCKPVRDENTIGQFFSLLRETKYDEALKLTEGKAGMLMRKITKEQSQEIADIVFKSLVLAGVSRDELLMSKEKDARVYRAGYRLELKDEAINPEVKKLLSKIGNGEVLVYINKKTGKISSLIDLKGGVFVSDRTVLNAALFL